MTLIMMKMTMILTKRVMMMTMIMINMVMMMTNGTVCRWWQNSGESKMAFSRRIVPLAARASLLPPKKNT